MFSAGLTAPVCVPLTSALVLARGLSSKPGERLPLPPRRDQSPVPPERNEPRVNDRIRVPRIRLIDEAGENLGEMSTEEALQLARERGLDLIEVAPTARPPVCKLSDFGKLKYEKKKKDALARKNQATVELKEIKVRPKTDDHDLDVKMRQIRQFVEEGDKVKITVRFRGREIAHRDIGEEQCKRLALMVADVAIVEQPARMDGRQMVMMLAPAKKK
jgi:translation initiation factor IF-3